MWSLVVNELVTRLTASGVLCIGYANRIVIIAQGKYEKILCDLVQTSLKIANERCRSMGLSINPAETTILPFIRKINFEHERYPLARNSDRMKNRNHVLRNNTGPWLRQQEP